jgi:hypothetical protein
MLAALLCGQGSDYVGGGLAQALSHAAGPRSSIANGVVEALLGLEASGQRLAGHTRAAAIDRTDHQRRRAPRFNESAPAE